jgi:hypothetical protein
MLLHVSSAVEYSVSDYKQAGMRWTAPPNWPQPPSDWSPHPGWQPEPNWGPAPLGWAFWRESDTGAPAYASAELRNPEMDENFRKHIQAGNTKAIHFLPFLQSMLDVLKFSYTDDPLKTRDGIEYRAAAQTSIEHAAAVLEVAVGADAAVPFVFLACMQDAQSLLGQFAATRSVMDGQATRTGVVIGHVDRATEPQRPPSAGAAKVASRRLSSEQYQTAIQDKMDRAARSLNVLIRPALAMSRSGGLEGRRGRALVSRLQAIGGLVSDFLGIVNTGADPDELLRVLNEIEGLVRPIAEELSIDYDRI